MKPATRSRSGAARAANREVNKGVSTAAGGALAGGSSAAGDSTAAGSLVVASGPGRIQQHLVAPKLVGPPRDQGGRFTRGGPVGAVSGRIQQMQEETQQVAAVDLEQQNCSDVNEVSDFESEEGDLVSSSANSDEEEEELEEFGNLNSGLLNAAGEKLADQVFDHMPQPCPTIPGVKLGAADYAEIPEKVEERAPWVNLFRNNRNLGKGIVLDEVEDVGAFVQLEEEDVDLVDEAWGLCLVGLFAGKFPGLGAVRNLREGWKVDCSHWIHRSGWIVFKFQSEEDRWKVLNGGPYFAYGRNLMLKIMPRCFRFGSEDLATVPVWIQLPDLPLDCWNARALSKIVSKVGKPISTDMMTRTKERISFARVLVEVDASKELITVVEVILPTGVVYDQMVVFEVAPKYCKKCKAFGHGDVGCNKDKEGRRYTAYVPKRKSQPGGVDIRPLRGKQKVGEASVVKKRDDLAVTGQTGTTGTGTKGDQPAVEPTVGVVKVNDIASNIGPKVVHDWLMSGPKVVQEASIAIQNMGPIPDRDRAKEVVSAVALALGIELEIEDVPTSEDPAVRGDGGADLRPIKSGLAADPATTCPGALAEEGHTSKNHGPDDGMEGSEVGWNVVGKKGKRKKKLGLG